jgi:hypothetical protein
MPFSVFAARGAMRHPLDKTIPGAATLTKLTKLATQALALQILQQAFTDFAAYQRALQPHVAYGALSHGDYA